MKMESGQGAMGVLRRCVLCGLLPSLCWGAWADESGSRATSKKTLPSSVWKVSSDTATVYLAGSVHLLRAQDYPLPPVYDVAYADSDRLMFEVDLKDMNRLDVQEELIALGSLPSGETIRDHVSEETYAKLQDYFQSRGVGGPMFESMRPGMLALTISSLEYMRMGAMPFLGVDMVYFKRAQEDEKPTKGLETVEFQMTLFDNLSPKKQEELLVKTLEGLGEAEEMTETLIEAWRTGDAKGLGDMLREEFVGDRVVERLLLTDRNESWVPQIEEILASDDNAMVVVGTGHLVGRKSVVQLLRKKGYEIKQMRYSPAKVRQNREEERLEGEVEEVEEVEGEAEVQSPAVAAER
ncbi:MAG: TraB/GumN family protein [Verrucomicrobiota bacterium]